MCFFILKRKSILAPKFKKLPIWWLFASLNGATIAAFCHLNLKFSMRRRIDANTVLLVYCTAWWCFNNSENNKQVRSTEIYSSLLCVNMKYMQGNVVVAPIHWAGQYRSTGRLTETNQSRQYGEYIARLIIQILALHAGLFACLAACWFVATVICKLQ